jgi:DnaK suppressor protein
MNGTEIEQCRQKLVDLLGELKELDEASREETAPAEPDPESIGSLSRKDAMQAQKAAEEGPRLRKRQIQKIEGALRRIDLDEFGRCFVCEEELDAERLFGDPTITRCIACEES